MSIGTSLLSWYNYISKFSLLSVLHSLITFFCYNCLSNALYILILISVETLTLLFLSYIEEVVLLMSSSFPFFQPTNKAPSSSCAPKFNS